MKKLLIILLLFASCKSKHTTTTITKTDTITKNSIIKIHPKQLNEIVIEEICDSLGNLRPIFYTSTSGKVRTTLKSDKNALKLGVNIDSLKQQWVKEYRSKTNTKEVVKVVTKKYIPKWVWYNLIYSILATLWIFRKPLIRIIKLI